MSTVAIVKGKKIDSMVQEIFGYYDFNFENKRVLLKPNLCNYRLPESGATTDVFLVKQIAKYLLSKGAKPEIIESDGSNTNVAIALELLGYNKLANELKIPVHILSREPTEIRRYPDNLHLRKFRYPKAFNDSDFFISIPKLKTMSVYGITCALKNQYGCNPSRRKAKLHPWLEEIIVDLNRIFPPNMIIVDGLIAMEGRGPSGGLPKKMDLLIGGDDPVSVDKICAQIMGLNPKRITQLKVANKHKLGNYEKITLKGLDLQEVKTKFRNPINPMNSLIDFAVKIAQKVGADKVM
ncbi:MAG: DUF362 domain-containing protein [Candidatus Ranarchaeia archaeon]